MPAGPVKRSVSVAVFSPGGDRVLTVRRPPDDDELPGLWGLPAASLGPGESHREAVERVGRDKLGVSLAPGEVLAEGSVERPAYRLEKRLFGARIHSGRPEVPQPAEGVTQYVAWEWAAPDGLRASAQRGSLCSRLCLEHLGESW